MQLYKNNYLKLKSNDGMDEYARRSHSHPEVSLGYIRTGSTTFTVLNQEYLLKTGDFVIIPAETIHLCMPGEGEAYNFSMYYIEASWWEQNIFPTASGFHPNALPLPDALKYLFRTNNSSNQLLSEDKTAEDLKRLIGDHLEPRFSSGMGSDLLAAVHEKLKNLPEMEGSLADLAEEAGMSEFTLIRKYARRYGLTPHADRINMRIQRAILLFETDKSLTEISLECGFFDQSHFIRQFKLYSGMRPQVYRRAILSNSGN